MSYLTFLLVFILPVIGGLLLLRRAPLGGAGGARARWAIPLVCLLALVWTTPWDNYLVWRGVWGYGNGRVLGTIGYVPVEEYAFFVLQPIMTGLLLYRLLERSIRPLEVFPDRPKVRLTGGAIAALTTAFGVWLLAREPLNGTYLGLILAWAPPVIGGMWLYAGHHFWAWRRPLLVALTVSTVYLWIADRFAIRNGIWDISNTYSFDLDPFGLPVEEAVFFLVTNVLSVLGTLLFLHGHVIRPFWKSDG